MDKLSIEEVERYADEAYRFPAWYQKKARVSLAKQLLDTMRENEQLREGLNQIVHNSGSCNCCFQAQGILESCKDSNDKA